MSDSQLRERSCTFFDVTKAGALEEAVEWLGDFSSATSTAKYAARMGQCFSPNRAVLHMRDSQFTVEPDIVRNGYEFTEGCGTISVDLAREVARKIKPKLRDDVTPSAFQVRFGEFKGVLVVDKKLFGEAVVFRASQKKFDIPNPTVEQRYLEVLNWTQSTRPASLNRQSLMLLHELGVPPNILSG